jgi:hypothetical protein
MHNVLEPHQPKPRLSTAFVGLIVVCAWGCDSSASSTTIDLTVETEPALALDSVGIAMAAPGKQPRTLPRSPDPKILVSIVVQGLSNGTIVNLQANGLRAGAFVVVARANVAVHAGTHVPVTMRLTVACAGVLSCASNQTCENGTCVAISTGADAGTPGSGGVGGDASTDGSIPDVAGSGGSGSGGATGVAGSGGTSGTAGSGGPGGSGGAANGGSNTGGIGMDGSASGGKGAAGSGSVGTATGGATGGKGNAAAGTGGNGTGGKGTGGAATGGTGTGGLGGVASTGGNGSAGMGIGGATPRCGDGIVTGAEKCDAAGSGSTNLGACNPECTGFYEKKFIRETQGRYSGDLGGPAGADQICQAEFGAGWKTLLVGGGRRATVTPLMGDGQVDWVLKKYTHYYNDNNVELIWRTDEVALLGVRDGQRMNLYADVAVRLDFYPWSGFDNNWLEVPTNNSALDNTGTCRGWTTIASGEVGTFALADLSKGRAEPCSLGLPLLCVQQ